MRVTPNPKIALLCLTASFAFAQGETPDTSGAQVLKTSTVQASVRPLDHIGKAPLVLTPSQWEGRGLGLADLLSTHAGIQTRRTGGMGSFQEISVRGVAGNKVLVCIDGIPVEDSHGSAANLGGIDLNQMERIEVYRSQVPAQFGGNGIGGVVNLVTRKSGRGSGRVYALYGSHNTGETSLSVSHPLTDSLRWNSVLSWRFSDNDYRFYNRNGTPYNQEDDHGDTRQNAAFSQFSGSHQWTWARPFGELRLHVAHSQQSGGLPGTESEQTQVAGFDRAWISPRVIWLSLPWSTGIRLETELGGTVEKSTLHWSNQLDGLGYGGDAEFQQVGTRTLQANGAVRILGEWNKPYSMEWHLLGSGEQVDPRDRPQSAGTWKWRLQRHQASSALEGAISPHPWMALRANHQITAMIDHHSGGVVHTSFPDTMAAERKTHLHQAAQGSLRIGPAHSFLRGNLSAGHHYRIPALQELFSTNLGVIPNPDLKPEQGENAEIGLELEFAQSRLQASWFWNQVREGIYWERSAGFARPANLSRSETVGFELEIHSHPASLLDIGLQATLQDPRNQSSQEAYAGNLSPNEPKISLGAETTLHLGKRWELGYRAEWHSEVFRDPANQMRIAPQANHHASLAYIPWEKGRVRFAANNLAGSDQQDIYMAYPTPGRQLFLSITQEF